jgi:hypothetical protein
MKRTNGTISAFERSDVVWGVDPFNTEPEANRGVHDDETGDEVPPRPWAIISDESVPHRPEQYICLTLTSRSYHSGAVPLDVDDWTEGGAPAESAILPWSVATIRHEHLDTTGDLLQRLDTDVFADEFELSNGYQGRLKRDVVDRATERRGTTLNETVK